MPVSGPIVERLPDFSAEITFASTEDGGRRNPVASGYRPTLDFGFGAFHDAVFEFIESEWVQPGNSAKTRVWLAQPRLQKARLYPGLKIEVLEGARCVAVGIIAKVINEELLRPKQSAQDHEPKT